MVYGRTRNAGKSQRKGERKVRAVPREQWTWSPEPARPALITREAWDAAQDIGAGPRRRGTPGPRPAPRLPAALPGDLQPVPAPHGRQHPRRTRAAMLTTQLPAASRDFMRFLLRWQHVAEGTRREGSAPSPGGSATGGRRGGAARPGPEPVACDAGHADDQVRKQPRSGETTRLSAVDPLNLAGVVLPGPRVPAVLTNTVTCIDGALAPVPEADGAAQPA